MLDFLLPPRPASWGGYAVLREDPNLGPEASCWRVNSWEVEQEGSCLDWRTKSKTLSAEEYLEELGISCGRFDGSSKG